MTRHQNMNFFVLTLLIFSAVRVFAQSDVTFQAYEEVYNGQLAIHEYCGIVNGWGTNYYTSVLAWNCQLINPDGGVAFNNNGGWQSGQSWVKEDLPISMSGTWQASSQYWIGMYHDDYFDSDSPIYWDPDGYSSVGIQICNSSCNLIGDGYYYTDVIDYQTLQIAQSSISIYVAPLTVQINPVTIPLEADESYQFTADVGGLPSGANTGVTWTLSNGNCQSACGSGSQNGNSYTYTTPSSISAGSELTLKACSIAVPTSCSTLTTIILLAESISVETPSPSTLNADGVSTSTLYADITNGPPNASVTWTASPPGSCSNGSNIGICSTGNTTATYTAPKGFPAGSTGATTPVNITATIIGSTPSISAATTLTLLNPVTITGVSPTSWAAGTTISPVIITGTGFDSSSQISISSPSWPLMSSSCVLPPTNTTTIQCSVTIPANLSNMTASQPATITVTTTSGVYTYPTAINIAPVSYTYGISLLTSTSSLWYGSPSTITPVITCKTSNGAACAGNVQNPQEANFSIINGVGLGSVSCASNCSSTTFTDTALIAAPSRNVTVQGCASVWTTVCATTNFTIPATSITLMPPTLPASLTAGKTQGFTASIQNEGTATGLTWTITPSPSNAAAGTLPATTAITVQGSPASGTSSNTYTAPNPIAVPTTVTLNACMSANTSICATPVAITLQPAPTFSVTASNNNPAQTALSLGHSMSYNVNVSALYGFTGPVTLSASGLPAGVTASFSPASINTSGSATLTLTSAYSTSTFIGNSNVTITGTSGGLAIPDSFPITTQPLQYKGACGVQ